MSPEPGTRRSAQAADVLVLTSTFPRHTADPCGRFVSDLVEALPYRCWVLSPADPLCTETLPGIERRITFTNPGVFYGDGGAVANLEAGRCGWWGVLRSMASMQLAAWRGARRARVIMAHWAVPAGLAAALCKTLLRTPFVLVLHSGDVWFLENRRWGRRVARFIAKRAAGIYGVERTIVARFAALTGRRGEVLGCGVARNPYAKERRTNGAGVGASVGAGVGASVGAGGAPSVGSMSRLVSSKGALALLERSGDLAGPLHIAGDGPQAERIASLCAEPARDAHYHGPVVGGDKLRYLADLDVFVAPYTNSDWGQREGLPIAILEAMAAGCAIVAYDTAIGGGMIDSGREGVIVASGDVDGLVAAVNDLLRDPTRRALLGEAAREKVQPYLLETVAQRWQDVLDPFMPDAAATGSEPR